MPAWAEHTHNRPIRHPKALVKDERFSAQLTEGSVLAVNGTVLLDLSIQLELLDTLVLGEKASRTNEVLQVLRSDAVLQLETFDLRLHDNVVLDYFAHASCSTDGQIG